MTSPVRGDLTKVNDIREVKERFKAGIMANHNQLIGSELETRLTRYGQPLTRDDSQTFFTDLHAVINNVNGFDNDDETGANGAAAQPGKAHLVREIYACRPSIVGIQGMAQGAFSWEPGLEPEFAGSVCQSVDEVIAKTVWAIDLVRQVARQMDYDVFFTGFDRKYAENVEFTPRSRGAIWESFAGQFPESVGNTIRHVHNGAAALQWTLDSGADRFHDIKSMLLLAEPAFALKYNSTSRLNAVRLCAEQFEAQFRPVTKAWLAKDVDTAVDHVIEHLWRLPVPFWNPNPYDLEDYRLTDLDASGLPQTVGVSVAIGQYTFQDINLAMGFLHHAAANRKLDKGYHEVRLLDSTDSVQVMRSATQFYFEKAYVADACTDLLNSARALGLVERDIITMHTAAHHWYRSAALERPVTGGYTTRDITDYLLGDGHLWNLPKHRSFSFSGSGSGREADTEAVLGSLSESILDTGEPLSGSAAVVALLDVTSDQVTVRPNGIATNGSALHDSGPDGADEDASEEGGGVDLDLVNSATAAAHADHSTASRPRAGATSKLGAAERRARLAG